MLAAACKKVFAEIAKQQEAAKRPKGRQSVRKLMNHHGGKNAMKYVGAPKDFDRIAKEFHVDYAFHKTGPGHYLLFFKADQADAIQAAFGKYTEKVMGRSQDCLLYTSISTVYCDIDIASFCVRTPCAGAKQYDFCDSIPLCKRTKFPYYSIR